MKLIALTVVAALLAACQPQVQQPMPIGQNDPLQNCSDIETDRYGNRYCDDDDDHKRKTKYSSYSNLRQKPSTLKRYSSKPYKSSSSFKSLGRRK